MSSLSGFSHLFGVICWVFPRVILKINGNRKIKLSSLQESIIMLSLCQLAIRLLPDHMNIHNKWQFASQFSYG